MTQTVFYYGIRHHGPGSAHTLRQALETLQPDCVLIEGPIGAEPLLSFIADAELKPPVALLSYAIDNPRLSMFHPFAVFSPEWQALLYAVQHTLPVHFIDLPAAITLALQKESEDQSRTPVTAPSDNELRTHEPNPDPSPKAEGITIEADNAMDLSADLSPTSRQTIDMEPRDPLDWLATAAGYGDGESWWNHLVEERGHHQDLFDAVHLAITELRENLSPRNTAAVAQEHIREAHMRLEIKKAEKQGYTRIAVVCGAWHVPALQKHTSVQADKAQLKNLPRIKTQATWIPWTYQNLCHTSGYAAGITAPGWYDYLWHNHARTQASPPLTRAIGWYVRMAVLLRQHGLDCSSAHLIEAARLANTLAALRERPSPGLPELNEAALSVLCHGNDAPLKLIEPMLMIGNALGTVPVSVPTVPLLKDIQAHQKKLRLKPETLEKVIDLDLRKENDLARSHLFHRLDLMGIHWGVLHKAGQKSKGTFHEYWRLAWLPQYEIDIILASRYGYSLISAATSYVIEMAGSVTRLTDLASLMDKVLLAHLPEAVNQIVAEIQQRSVETVDPLDLLETLPSLANIYRYGNVRKTDIGDVAQLFDSLFQRAVIALPLALCHINQESAIQLRDIILNAERAVTLRAEENLTQLWQQTIAHVVTQTSAHALLRGLCCRLSMDNQQYHAEAVIDQCNLNLSQSVEATEAAFWLEGFLNRNASVLLHSESLWNILDRWLTGLSDAHFIALLPLIRRIFSEFERSDRRDLGQKVSATSVASVSKQDIPASQIAQWDETRLTMVLEHMTALLGIPRN